MKIQSITNIYNCKNISKSNNSKYKANGLQNDCFIKSTSFGKLNDGKSFYDFDQWAKREKFRFHARDIIEDPTNYFGKDTEGHIYKIPDCDRWIIKKHTSEKLMPMLVKETCYTEIEDVSPLINIGQPIASLRVPLSPRITQHYYVHKAQNGGELGLQSGLMKNVNSGTAGKHVESLSKVQALDPEVFDALVKDVQAISDMQFNFNGNIPNNLVLDTDTPKINICGLTKSDIDAKSQHTEVLYALLGSDFTEKFENSHRPDVEKANARKFSKTIAAKYLIAMKNNNAKFGLTDNFKNLILSSTFSSILKTDDPKEKLIRLRKNGLI